MPDRPAGVPVVRRVVFLRIVEWRLQHSRREVDVVHLRIEISIHCRRRHPPLAVIHRLAHLCPLPLLVEDASAHHVAQVVRRADRQRRIIAPLIRIPNLIPHRMQLHNRLLLRRIAHPVEVLDLLLHRCLDLLRHLQHLALGVRAECPRHELLPQRLPKIPVHLPLASLPSRLHLRSSSQILAEKTKLRFLEIA